MTLMTTIAVVVEGVTSRPSFSAEAVRFYVDGPMTVSLSFDSLKIFAETGAITGDLKLFSLFFNDQMMGQLRQGLQRKLSLDVVQTYKLSYSPLGQDVLKQLGKVVRFTPKRNGFYGLRAALIGAAANSDALGLDNSRCDDTVSYQNH